MGGALVDTSGAALGTSAEALEGHTFVNVGLLDVQVVLAERLAGLVGLHTSVGDGALQGLADRQGRSLRGELQNGDGFGRLLAADEVDHAASLARRHADVTSDCFSFHVLFLILSDGPSCRPSRDP